jgi:GntR family transcriptional regulator of arabinose operon
MKHSRAQQIAESIQSDYIDNGLLVTGDKLPQIRDLLAKYGASHVTIGHALGILEMRGVIDKRHGVGCFVKRSRETQNRMLAFICETPTYEVMVRIYRGIDMVCKRRGFQVMMGDANWDYMREHDEVQRAVESGCSAIVLCPATRNRHELENDYLKTQYTDFPMVLVDIAYPEQGHSQVLFDNYRAGYDMASMLIRDGHKRIAYMEWNTPEGDLMHRPNQDRIRGYMDAFRDAGIDFNDSDVWHVFRDESHESKIEEYIRHWMQQSDHPTAVMALEDQAAIYTICCAQDLGVSVPRELCVTGFDGLAAGKAVRPRFSTTAQDYIRAGELAAEMAIEQVNGPANQPASYLLPMPIVRHYSSPV